MDSLRSVKVLLPNLLEQQKIADCLTSLDEKIDAQNAKIESLKAHKKGLMQKLFPADGANVPTLRFPEFVGSDEWKEKKLGEVAVFHNGRAYKQDELLSTGKYKVLRVGNFFTSSQWYYSDLLLDDSKYCNPNDLLYAWSASFGPRIWTEKRAIYHYHIWKIELKHKNSKLFLFWLLNLETDKLKMKSLNGFGMLHITKKAIENWSCYFPTTEEQQQIADCLTSLDELIITHNQKLELLKEHKKGLMQKLFP